MFTNDSKAVAYTIRHKEEEVDNVRTLPLAGSASGQLTHFKSGQINQFTWSPGGKEIAILRRRATSDVVLVSAGQP